MKLFLSMLFMLIGIATRAESHLYLTRDLPNSGTQGIELVCLDKPKLCRVSRTLNSSDSGFKDLPQPQAEAMFKGFARDLEKIPAGRVATTTGRALRLDFAYGKTRRKETMAFEGTHSTQTQLIFMKIEAGLEAALQ